MAVIEFFGDPISGNCLKVKWTADYLGLDYEWTNIDILKGDSRTDAYLARNPFGQVPCAVFADGSSLSQSNAIVLHLAEGAGNKLLPNDSARRAKVYEWMFWEQNSHEPYIAGRRFRKFYRKLSDEEIDAEWLPRGKAALERMSFTLEQNQFLVGPQLTAADISLVAYTRCAHEGGFDLDEFPAIQNWIGRVENVLAIAPYGAA